MIEINSWIEMVKNKKLINLLFELNHGQKIEFDQILDYGGYINKEAVKAMYKNLGIELKKGFFIDIDEMRTKHQERLKIKYLISKGRLYPLSNQGYRDFFHKMFSYIKNIETLNFEFIPKGFSVYVHTDAKTYVCKIKQGMIDSQASY